MAKPLKGDNEEQNAPQNIAQVRYRDKVYRTRTLILQDGRSLPVEAFTVTVTADDEPALKYLAGHPEFELIKE
jgi:hypothetical protein